MDKSEILLLIAIMVFVAFRLYRKYGKKTINANGNNSSAKSKFPGVSNDDEYEPYSGK